MGDKVAARRAAAAAGLPVIPGTEDACADVVTATRLADEIGYPVLLKAAAGGGGRGMRIVRAGSELEGLFHTASAEAAAAFGDDRLYVEKLIEGGRHIEYQVLADGFGHALHLFERECSVQRNHQKLIEETPSPAMTAERVDHFGATVAAAVSALGYVGAGTVEFLLDPSSDELYFLETNTRLQVEHPITEMTTGIDLVAWQLRIAAGERLDLTQGEVRRSGHAIECRINAEDPADGFRPGAGRITRLVLPRQGHRRWRGPRHGNPEHE
jgi:acetyl-CoA carboxylase biotin carboxylase subunit